MLTMIFYMFKSKNIFILFTFLSFMCGIIIYVDVSIETLPRASFDCKNKEKFGINEQWWRV